MKYHSCPKCEHRFRRAIYDNKTGKLRKGVCGFCGFIYNSEVKDISFHNLELMK